MGLPVQSPTNTPEVKGPSIFAVERQATDTTLPQMVKVAGPVLTCSESGVDWIHDQDL